VPVNSLVVFPELDINTGIDLSGFGLKVLQSLWMVSADPEISQSKSGDQSGDIIFGVLQKSKVKQFTCLVTGISQDDLREKLDNIEKHLNPTRGNLWFKFDMDSSSNIDVTRRRMVRGRRNSPIQVTYLGGMLRAKFQFSVLVNSGHENSIALTESLTNAISADPTVVVVPLVGGISNTRVFARIDIINNGSDIPDGTDITVANDGVDIDGDVVTSGVFTLTGGLQYFTTRFRKAKSVAYAPRNNFRNFRKSSKRHIKY